MKQLEPKKILVVAAHPDDEVLGCGASIKKHTANGSCVWTLILGEGVTARRDFREAQKKRALYLLKQSAVQANKHLGVQKLIMENFPDNQFDSVPLLAIIHTIEKVLDAYKPDIIYTHHYGDVNIDHRIAHNALESCLRPMEKSCVTQAFAFEIASSTEWNFKKHSRFSPNMANNIEEKYLKAKIEALQGYASEIRPFPHPRSPEYLRALAMVRGSQFGFPLAEAFELIYLRNK